MRHRQIEFSGRGIIEQWGRGTLKIAALTEKAVLPRPDINAVAGALTVRFLPSQYLAPSRLDHSLSETQQLALQVIGRATGGIALQDIAVQLGGTVEERRVRQDLQLLKQIGAIALHGHGRGARWALAERGAK